MRTYFNLPAVFFIALVVVCVLVLGTLAQIWNRARAQGWRLLDGESPAADPGSLHTFLLASATIIGGLWAVFSIVEAGAYELERLTFAQAKQQAMPHLEIAFHTELLSPGALVGADLIPLHILVTVQNSGQQEVPLELDKIALLSLAPVRARPGETPGGVDPQIVHLPYLKIACREQHQCALEPWTQATLAPGGVGYYTFLHPGLPPGIYYVQFQLPVPEILRKGAGGASPHPGVWTRSTYVEVKPPPVLGHGPTVTAAGGPPGGARVPEPH